MKEFFVLIVFVAIGSIFGPIGIFIGLGLGIVNWIMSSNNQSKGKPVPSEEEAQLFAGTEHPSGSRHSLRGPAKPSQEQAKEYATSVANLYACILCIYPRSEISKVDDVTELLKSDDWIANKHETLDLLAERLPHMQSERHDSPMLFQLHSNALLERVLKLPTPMKSRLAMQLDSLSSGPSTEDPKNCNELVDKFRLALRKDFPVSIERLEAEEFITRSGDPLAISTLQKMRRNPSQYKDILKSGATGNTVLKTAFGVFAGILAAEAVKAAVTDYQMKNLLTQLDQDIEKAGGLDSVLLEDKELESLATTEMGGGALSSFNEDADVNTGSDELADVPHDGVGAESIYEDAADFRSNVSNIAEPDVEVADSSSDLSFDSDI